MNQSTPTNDTIESKQILKVGRKTFTIEKRVNANGAYIQLTESGRDRLKIPLEEGASTLFFTLFKITILHGQMDRIPELHDQPNR